MKDNLKYCIGLIILPLVIIIYFILSIPYGFSKFCSSRLKDKESLKKSINYWKEIIGISNNIKIKGNLSKKFDKTFVEPDSNNINRYIINFKSFFYFIVKLQLYMNCSI